MHVKHKFSCLDVYIIEVVDYSDAITVLSSVLINDDTKKIRRVLSLEPNKAHFFFQENVTDPVRTVDFPRFYPLPCHRITINLLCFKETFHANSFLFISSYELLKFRERAIITRLMEGHLWLWKYPRKTLFCILANAVCLLDLYKL